MISSAIHRLTQNELTLWLNYIEHEVGFVLPSAQVNWIKGVIERHLAMNQQDSHHLLASISHDRTLYHRLFDDILIPRTQFFRHMASFDYVARYAQYWQAQKLSQGMDGARFRAWSVGCSSGQEAVSLALTLKQRLSTQQDFLVYGSDFHQKALRQAQASRYDINELAYIPSVYHSWFDISKTHITVCANIKRHLNYFSKNLVAINEPVPILPNQCQIIVCKNVLIYFRQFEQRDIVKYLSQFLAPEGILLLGVGELLQLADAPLMRVPIASVNAYCRSDAPTWVKQLTL